jgi:hypothetical protein
VRAAAVLRLSSEERELLATFAEDNDPRVRKAAVKKSHDPALLCRIAGSDADPGVREEAAEALVTLALHAKDAERGRAAIEGLAQPRHLLALVRSAAEAATRRAALEKLQEARALAAAAREAPDAELRLLAVARLDDPGLLLSLAQNSEHKPVALAAVDKLTDEAALRAIAGRARSPAAGRRAKARLASPTPAPPPLPEAGTEDAAEREAYERKLAALRAEEDARARALAERVACCETLEAAAAERAAEAMEKAREAWAAMTPLPGPEAEALERRLEAALAACRRRSESFEALAAVRERLSALVAEAEALAAGEDLAAAREGLKAVHRKWQEASPPAEGTEALRARLQAAEARLREREVGEKREREAKERENLDRLRALADRLEALLKAEAPALRDAERAMREAKEALDHTGPLPSKKDRNALRSRLESARKTLYPRLQELRADTEWKRWANESVQEELVRRAEALRAETNLDRAAHLLRDLDARWKAAAEVDKEKGEELWKHFKAARDEVKARVDAHFEKRAAEFAENLKKKEALVARAEALQDSTEWLKTADEMRRLQAEWKAVGPTAHAPGKAAWERFRKACDRFFTRREEDLKQRKDEWARNEANKQALIERAEALAGSTDWEAATAEIRRLQAEWKTAGPVKKSRSEPLWQRFRAACDLVFARYKRRDEIALEKSQVEREALLGSLESLLPAAGADRGPPPSGLAAKVAEVQAAWRQAGPLPREEAAMGSRFRRALHGLVAAFPEAFKGSDLDPEAARKKMEKLCARVEALAPASSGAERSLAEQLKDALATNTMGGRGEADARRKAIAEEVRAARESFARLPPVPGAEGEALHARFEAAARRALDSRR